MHFAPATPSQRECMYYINFMITSSVGCRVFLGKFCSAQAALQTTREVRGALSGSETLELELQRPLKHKRIGKCVNARKD